MGSGRDGNRAFGFFGRELGKGVLYMSLRDLLAKEKEAFVKKWFRALMETYPPETTKFFGKEANQFTNPVGHTIRHGIEGLYAQMLQGMDPEKLRPWLDRIIRIRAVQDFDPSQAVAFAFFPKGLVREIFEKEIRTLQISPDELAAFDALIDRVSLLAFDVYMQCREKLYELKVNELKNRTFRLLQMAGLAAEIPEFQADEPGGNT